MKTLTILLCAASISILCAQDSRQFALPNPAVGVPYTLLSGPNHMGSVMQDSLFPNAPKLQIRGLHYDPTASTDLLASASDREGIIKELQAHGQSQSQPRTSAKSYRPSVTYYPFSSMDLVVLPSDREKIIMELQSHMQTENRLSKAPEPTLLPVTSPAGQEMRRP